MALDGLGVGGGFLGLHCFLDVKVVWLSCQILLRVAFFRRVSAINVSGRI